MSRAEQMMWEATASRATANHAYQNGARALETAEAPGNGNPTVGALMAWISAAEHRIMSAIATDLETLAEHLKPTRSEETPNADDQ